MHNEPRFHIPRLSFANVSYCELYNAFGNGWVVKEPGTEPVYEAARDECKAIRDMGDLLAFHQATVGQGRVDTEVRDSKVAWIDDNPNHEAMEARQWVIGRIADTIAMVNRDKFQLELDYFRPIQYTKYALDQYYDWHCDSDEGSEAPEHRKLSAVLMLTGPDDYEGGELELNINGNPEKTLLLRPPAGTVIFFRSHVPHRVRPVTKGNRASLVVWAMGPKGM